MVTFDLVPQNILSPLSYTEIAPSRSANTLAQKDLRVLCIGQKRAGTIPALTTVKVTSTEQAQTYFGAGSQLHMILTAWFANNKGTEVYGIPLADAGGAVAEVRTLTVSGTVTAAGVAALYFAGVRVAVAVAAGEANATTAANIAAAITATPSAPFIASVAGAVVTITAKNAGTLGAELDYRNSYGANEALPTGLQITPAVTTPGTGTVDYTALGFLSGTAAVQWDLIVSGANDAANLGYITAELLDRWGPVRQIEGTVYSGFKGDLSASLTQGGLLNSQFSVQMPANASPTPAWSWAGAMAGVVALEGGRDPARGFHTLTLKGVLPPTQSLQFTADEQEQLLRKGLATWTVGADGSVQIRRLVTNYQTNAGGAKDPTFRSLNTILTLAYLRYDWRTMLLTKYPRHKLANDGGNFGEGQPIMTPERGRAEAVAWFQKVEKAGLVEGLEQFKRDLKVERNGDDPNRMDFLLPINLVNQLEVVAARIEFTL